MFENLLKKTINELSPLAMAKQNQIQCIIDREIPYRVWMNSKMFYFLMLALFDILEVQNAELIFYIKAVQSLRSKKLLFKVFIKRFKICNKHIAKLNKIFKKTQNQSA